LICDADIGTGLLVDRHNNISLYLKTFNRKTNSSGLKQIDFLAKFSCLEEGWHKKQTTSSKALFSWFT